MASLPYLIPTARYKRAVKVGNKVTFKPEDAVIDNGIITDLYWSLDQAGNNRVTSVETLTEFYLQVRTQDIYTTVGIQMESTIDIEEVIEGIIDRIYAIPITTNSTGAGWGWFKYNIEEDIDVFKNSKWVNLTAQRAFNVDYTNDTGKTIEVAVTSANGSSGFTGWVDGVKILTSYSNYNTANPKHAISICVPPGSVYRFSGGTMDNWAELRPIGT